MWRWMRRILIAILLLVLGLISFALAYVRIGPTGPVPAADPFIALNEAHANLEENAADVYWEAFELYVPPPDEDWNKKALYTYDLTKIMEQATAWLEQNEPCYSVVSRAARFPDCWFTLERGGDHKLIQVPYPGKMRSLIKLCTWRGALAAERRNLAAVEDSVLTLNAVARHLAVQPIMVSHLVSQSGMANLRHFALAPLTWTELSSTERIAYVQHIRHVFAAPPSMVPMLRLERDEHCWHPFYRDYASAWISPPSRVAGEIDRYFQPVIAWTSQRPGEQADPNNPLFAEYERVDSWQWTPAKMLSDPIRETVHQYMPSYSRAIDLRLRVLILLRGFRTACEVFAFKDQRGRFPKSLEELDGDYRIDPYTTEPFLYHETAAEFVLYSAALDRDDDGGVHDERWGWRYDREAEKVLPPDGDYIFWPLPEWTQGD